jgi:hypothetical protein
MPLVLQGAAAVNVYSMLRFSGDLLLKGMPDRPGFSGSWVLNTIINLTSTGFLEYQVGSAEAVRLWFVFVFMACVCVCVCEFVVCLCWGSRFSALGSPPVMICQRCGQHTDGSAH